MASSSARIGVIPIPEAMSRTLRRVRTPSCSRPYGPSKATLVPGRKRATRAHPYSLSAAPDGRTLRITAAHLGDGSARLARLRPGTRVAFEGPYGRLHEGVRTRRKVLLMASGIGITPMRALLEAMDQRPGDVTLVYRARSDADQI